MIDDKTLNVLEFKKVLDQLAGYCAFSASQQLALELRPVSDPFEARRRQKLTSEAQRLINKNPDLTIGGARDIRPQIDLANHGGVLSPNELLDIKSTLVAARNLERTFERFEALFPALTDLVRQIPAVPGIIDTITKSLSDRGDILDSASEKLSHTRRDMRVVHDRLLSRLQKMVVDPRNTPYLQEPIVTQRDGRYVLPLRAEFKGRIRSIVHDQSASGATLFVEPVGVVDMNNSYRELQLIERDEERRILTEISHAVALQADQIIHVVDIIAVMDLKLACARYSDDLRASEPNLLSLSVSGHEAPGPADQNTLGSKISSTHRHPTIRLYQARHPLLPKEQVVPIDFELDPQTFALVITGPNTGGKTVALKTVGLLALMAQSGLHIPAGDGSELSVFQAIFADIGDEQSIEQSLSTFSGHITNIIRILESADESSLVILDELGAGTDPQEGSALARAILTHLVNRKVMTLVTTHHPELKLFAHTTPGVVNASVEFDIETLRPTYHLTIGLPGRSNALAIAQRLGMPENIIAAARTEIHPDELRADDLLDEIHHQRDIARRSRLEAEQLRLESESLRNELMERLDAIEEERRSILEDARSQSELQLTQLAEEITLLRRQMARVHQPADAADEIGEKISELSEIIGEPVEGKTLLYGPELQKHEQRQKKAITIDARVRIRSLGTQGVVIALDDDEAEVQVGVMRVRARLEDLEIPSASGAVAQPRKTSETVKKNRVEAPIDNKKKHLALTDSPGMEINLRGQRADDAVQALERYLDTAFLSGMPFVRIIHGKGTGRLREVVRQVLKESPHVRSFESGGEKEGGDGVTVAKLIADNG